MKYLLLLCLLFIITGNNLMAQSLIIKLTDSSKATIDLAYIKYNCSTDKTKPSQYTVVRGNFCVLTTLPNCRRLTLEISAPGYEDYLKEIEIDHYTKDTINCTLTKNNIKYLEPVVVTAKSGPIQIKTDTTTYLTKAFSNGTEEKLIDLLEKLPGIDVNKRTGEIRFKGKPIETILIEGDNLFGTNYTLGSKNINAKIVTEIQAIEHYAENYILKGLENEDKIALNIKIDKTNSQFRISGNSEIGLGFQENETKKAANINTNLLGTGSALKFFSTLSHNNVGANNAPIDYSGNNMSMEQIKEKKYTAQKFIYEPVFLFENDKNYSNINSELFGNNNALFKLSPKLTLKSSVFYQKDRISNQQFFEHHYFTGNDTFRTYDLITGQRKPETIKWDLNLRHAISSNALFEITISELKETIQSFRECNSNHIPNYLTRLHSGDRYQKLLATYTQRINKRQALQIELRSTRSIIHQIYSIIPSDINTTTFKFSGDQESDFYRHYTHLTATLFGTLKNIKYNFYLKNLFDRNNYSSKLSNSQNNVSIIAQNKVLYTKPATTHGGSISLSQKRLKLTTAYQLALLQQQWIDQLSGIKLSKNKLYLEPNVNLKYVLTRISTLSLNFSITYRNTNDQYLFPDRVIQSFRNVTDNKTSLDLVKTNMMSFSYSRSDLFNQFDQGISFSLQTSNRDYLPAYTISDTFLFTNFSMQAVENNICDIHLYLNKYIPGIKSTVKFSLTNTVHYYNNLLSSEPLRRNTNHSIGGQLFFKTLFKEKLNFETENNFSIRQSKNEFNKLMSNLNYTNSARVIFIPNKIFKMFLSGDYYRPNLKLSNSALFLTYTLSVKPAKPNIEIKLVANNITNTTRFLHYQVSDFSRSVSRTNTLPRNFLLYIALLF